MSTDFTAPWSHSLKVTTGVGAAILGVIPLFALLFPTNLLVVLFLIGLPVGVLLTAFAGSVRGYVLSNDEIQIERPFGRTRLPLRDLQTVEGKSDAMDRRIRLAANGGLFSFSGFFWNRNLGFFRAYATDPSRSVVLRFAKRKVVITPHDPQQFIMKARMIIKTREFPS